MSDLAASAHGGLMDRIYRYQRHIYDVTRKYYLLGRDSMIAGLDASEGSTVLEVGCGTGRNLVLAARRYPSARIFGFDISREMLESAGKSVAGAGLVGTVRLACADATTFDPQAVFGRKDFDRIFISYSVSMIPVWEAAIRRAAAHLAPGGELHIVDFGDQARLPAWFRGMLLRWLALFHVEPRTDLFEKCASIAEEIDGTFEAKRLYRGYAWLAVIRRTQARD
jgi:S-adenosylmethionine-diacylgycerolhomoserine-N-methlytransferase